MPIYEYKCNNCGTLFEVLQNSNERASCPVCQSKNLLRKFSVFASISSKPESACQTECSASSDFCSKADSCGCACREDI